MCSHRSAVDELSWPHFRLTLAAKSTAILVSMHLEACLIRQRSWLSSSLVLTD